MRSSESDFEQFGPDFAESISMIYSFMPTAADKSKRYISQMCEYLGENSTCRALS